MQRFFYFRAINNASQIAAELPAPIQTPFFLAFFSKAGVITSR